jgi:hypothetical protein
VVFAEETLDDFVVVAAIQFFVVQRRKRKKKKTVRKFDSGNYFVLTFSYIFVLVSLDR